MIYYTQTPDFYNDYIAHYGILGMKWGHRKLDRQIAREKKFRAKTMKGRSKYRSKLENRYNKKIAKAKSKGKMDKVKKLTTKRNYKLTDHDKGTEFFDKATKYRVNTVKNYQKAQDKAWNDRSSKKSSTYKVAKLRYANQKLSDMFYGGKAGTSIGYASDIATGRHNYMINEEKLKRKYKLRYGK